MRNVIRGSKYALVRLMSTNHFGANPNNGGRPPNENRRRDKEVNEDGGIFLIARLRDA